MSNALRNVFLILASLAGLWVAARGIAASSSPESVATLIVASIVLPAIGAGGVAILILATLDRTRHRYEAPPPTTPAEYNVLPYQPPRPALPPPRVVRVPRFIDNGTPRPTGAPPPIMIETTAGDDDDAPGERLALPLSWLMRFAACPTPARSEWTGDKTKYAESARVFLAHGLLNRSANNGYEWKSEYPLSARREWLAQFEAVDAR